MRSTVLLFAIDGAASEGDFVAYVRGVASDEQSKRLFRAPSLALGEGQQLPNGSIRFPNPTRAALRVLGNGPRVLDDELGQQIATALQGHNLTDLFVPVDHRAIASWLAQYRGRVVFTVLVPPTS